MSSPKDRQKKASKTSVKAAVKARAAATPAKGTKAKAAATPKGRKSAKSVTKAIVGVASKQKVASSSKPASSARSGSKVVDARAAAETTSKSHPKSGKPVIKTSQAGTAHKAIGKVLANNEPQSLGKRPSGSEKLFKLLSGTGVIMTKTTQPKGGTKGGPVGKGAPQNGRSGIALPPGYRPSDSEPFMNERQRVYFRGKLIAWKEEIVRQNMETLHGLHEDSSQHADLADRATSETDRALELRARDRQRKLVAKIDAALARIEEGTYGYCEETGEPISLKRLDARPIATMSIEAQERHERRERVFRED